MIPPGFIHDLLSRTDIVEVVGRHVELKKAGINHKGLCPFHGEKSPSFIVSPTRQTYHCFGCGVHGNAIGFLMEHAGLGFVEAVTELAQQAGLQVPQDERSAEERERAAQHKQRQSSLTEVLQRASDHYRAQLKKSPRAIDYLKRRGLTGQIAARFALGYAPEGWRALASAFASYDDPMLVETGLVILKSEDGDSPPSAANQGAHGAAASAKRYDRFRDRIMFPIRNVQGDTIGFGGRVLDRGEPKYLNSPETPVFSKGRELYGLHEARQGLRQRGYALVVEGYMDVVALAQHGFGNAVATLGTACTAEHVQKLFRFTESVVFSFDGDAAGRRAAGRALEAALPHASDTRSIRFLFLPPEHDPDSYVREFGADAFERCVADAVPLSRQLLESAAEGCDLASAEGRARFLSHAQPLWQALPAGLLKRQLIGDLARRAQLPEQELLELWQGQGRPGDAPSPPENGNAAPTGPRATRSSTWNARKGGDWKRRDPGHEDRPSLPRRQPASPADHALRMLFLNSDWWEQLGADDHQLLHELPGGHGELIAWLERYLVAHGPAPWSVLEAALADDAMRHALAPLGDSLHAADDCHRDDLTQVMRTLWVERLEAEAARLSSGALQAQDLTRIRELRDQIKQLKAASTA